MLEIVSQVQSIPLHTRLRWLRWLTPVGVLVFVLLHQAGLHYLVNFLPERWHLETELLVYALTGSLIAWVVLNRIADTIEARTLAEARLRSAYSTLETRHQKLLLLQNYGRKITAAESEQAVFALAAQAPLQLTEAKGTTVIMFDDISEQLKLEMAWGLSDDYLRALRSMIDAGIPAAHCRMCSELKTQASSDCPLFTGLLHEARAEGISSLICLPVQLEQERGGVISVYYPSPAGPTEDQVRLLNILGATTGAMLASLRWRTRQAHLEYPIDRLNTSNTMSGSAFGDFARQIMKLTLEGWEACAGGVFLLDAATGTWSCATSQNLGDDFTDPRFDLALDLVRQSQASSHPVIIPELSSGRSPAGWQSALASPLMAEGRLLGALFLAAERRRAFNSRHFEFLNTMSHQIALGLRNMQLYEQIDQTAVIRERTRLSREIHDGLAQSLAFMALQTETLEKLVIAGKTDEAVRELLAMRHSIRSAYTESREAIEGLRLDLEKQDDFPIRLRELVTQFSLRTGIQTQVIVAPENLLVDPAAGLQLLRITQEALSNVRKHAQASRVEICLRIQEQELEMSIVDDGQGFPVSAQADPALLHFGLTTMRERAHSLGGALTVATGPRQGTRINVALPYLPS